MIESDDQVTPSNTPSDFPWPPRESDSVLEAAASTWKESVFHPSSFFRRMPRESNFGWVLGYYIVVGVMGMGLSLFWEMVLGGSLLDRFVTPEESTNRAVEFLLSPLILLVVLYVASGIVHVFLLMFGGAKHGYGTTVRVFAFSIGPALFEVVPFVGGVISGIWSLVLTVIGLREAHDTSTGRAVAAVLVPALVFGGLIALLILIGLLVGATQIPV